jgi:hypothetical protein
MRIHFKVLLVLAAVLLCGSAMAGVMPVDLTGLGYVAMLGITAPFETQARLTQIAMAVKPQGMIADLVCPRVRVDGEKFVYDKLITEDMFAIQDTRVGRSSEPNQVEFGATQVTDKVEDHGLDDFVPNRDRAVANAQGANFDPFTTATEGTSILVELAREKRVADLYFNLNTYSASLRATLSGTGQWSDYANSDPYTVIMAALDDMLVRPNMATFGRKVFTKLRSHPKIVAAVLNNGGGAGDVTSTGSVTKQALADLLELSEIHVGETFSNTAKKGQTASFARLWGSHAAFHRIDRSVRSTQGYALPTFAMTAQWEDRFVTTIPEPKRGLKGGTTVRVGEQVKEIITFQDAGYFFQNVIS